MEEGAEAVVAEEARLRGGNTTAAAGGGSGKKVRLAASERTADAIA